MNELPTYDPRRWRRDRWDEPGTIYFWSGRAGEHVAFSNFAATPFAMPAWLPEIGEIAPWATGEHAFQAAKAAATAKQRGSWPITTALVAADAGWRSNYWTAAASTTTR